MKENNNIQTTNASEFEMLKVTKNKDKFRQPAIHYEKYKCYTFAPQGTSEWINYWQTELDRCRYGFMADDGDSITGYYYFYLNYSRIMLVKDIKKKRPDGTYRIKAERIEDFPRFYDYDRAYFDAVEKAELDERHLAVLKARGKGYSFKGASMLVRNFLCIPNSVSYAIASEAEFLTKDGLLTKAWDMIEWCNQNTAFYKSSEVKNTQIHRRASYRVKEAENGDIWTEGGYKSEIIGVTLKNDPQKARGKRGKLILFEEAGKFPHLKTAWQVARPSVEEDGKAFGTMIAYGTGGTEDADYEGLKDLFYEPDAYNCAGFDNVWDEGMQGTKCGFFIPQSSNMTTTFKGHRLMDDDGNTNFYWAEQAIQDQRKRVMEASDRRAVDRHIAEQPLTPEEACLNISSNIFPLQELTRHLAMIRNDSKFKNYRQPGTLEFDENGKVIFKQADRPRDIRKYRMKKDDPKEGQVVIWEHPVDNPPYGLYIAGCDPYDHDKSGTNSLGSVFIYKRFQSFEEYYDIPVAEYTGRPDTANDFYEIVRKLLLYYRATLLYENEKKGLFFYFEKMHCTHLLADQPDIINDIIKDSKVQRKKGIHMNQSIKDWGEGAIRDWLIEEYADGRKNLTKILSEPLLEELIAYNDEGNFDRVMAFMMVMIYQTELQHTIPKKKKESNRAKLFDTPLFDQNVGFNSFGSSRNTQDWAALGGDFRSTSNNSIF